MPSDADCVGEGGGTGEAERAELGDVVESSGGDIGGCTDDPDIARLVLDAPDIALVVDLIDAASDLSPFPEPIPSAAAIADVEALGLSFFPLPGIFDLMAPLMERDDSFVSDLLNDGYDCSPSPAERSTAFEGVFADDPDPSDFFDCC